MKLETYKIETASKLDNEDKLIIKQELLERLNKCLDYHIEKWVETSNDDIDKIVEDAEDNLKLELLDDNEFEIINTDHELINVDKSDEMENWDFQRVFINSWANNKI